MKSSPARKIIDPAIVLGIAVLLTAAIAMVIAPADALPGYAAGTHASHNAPRISGPIARLVEAEAALGERVVFGDRYQVSLRFADEHPAVGRATFILTINDIRDNSLVIPDNTMHRAPVHAYIAREDLRGTLIHIHPPLPQDMSGEWRQNIEFPYGGAWYAQAQFPKDGVLYQINTSFVVSGSEEKLPEAPSVQTSQRSGSFLVELDTQPPVIRAGILAVLTATISQPLPVPGGFSDPLYNPRIASQSNAIFTLVNGRLLWNAHGDKSVDDLSAATNFPVVRLSEPESFPFAYRITFPAPGLWLMHIEGLEVSPARFFIRVEP